MVAIIGCVSFCYVTMEYLDTSKKVYIKIILIFVSFRYQIKGLKYPTVKKVTKRKYYETKVIGEIVCEENLNYYYYYPNEKVCV